MGRGGMATVFRAREDRYERDVAIKILPPLSSPGAGDKLYQRFRRECRLLGRVSQHPYIVTLYDDGMTRANEPYLVMEFCGGGSMFSRLAEQGPLPVEEVLSTGVRMADSLEWAHQLGVMHGDVKPGNILLWQEGEPRLCDFGIGQLADATMGQTSRMSYYTVAFAPPEQISEEPLSPRSDLYSLGATLYTMVAGRPPFEGHVASVINQVMNDVPSALDAPACPPDLSELVVSLLAKDPSQRPESAYSVAETLASIQQQHSFAPTRVYSTAPTRRPDVELATTVAAPAAPLAPETEPADEPPPPESLVETLPVTPPETGILETTADTVAMAPAQHNSAQTAHMPAASSASSSGPVPEQPSESQASKQPRGRWLIPLATLAVVGVVLAIFIIGQQLSDPDVDNAEGTVPASPTTTAVASTTETTAVEVEDAVPVLEPVAVNSTPLIGAVWRLALDSGHGRVASVGVDDVIRIWDSTTGQPVGSPMAGNTDRVWNMTFNADGTRLFSAAQDGRIIAWDVETGELLTEVAATDRIRGRISSIAVNPDSKWLATAHADGLIRLWDPGTLASIGELTGHEGGALSLAVHPGGDTLYSGGADGIVRQWQVDTETEAAVLWPGGQAVRELAIDPESGLLAAGSTDSHVRVWDVADAQLISDITTNIGWIEALDFDSGGAAVAVSGFGPLVQVFDPASGALRYAIEDHTDWVQDLKFDSSSGQLITAGNDGDLAFRDADDGKRLTTQRPHSERIRSVAVTADGSGLATADDGKAVTLWDSATGQITSEIALNNSPLTLDFNGDGSHLVAAGFTGNLHVVEAASGTIAGEIKHAGGVARSVAFRSDSSQIAVALSSGTLELHDVNVNGSQATGSGATPIDLGEGQALWSVAYDVAGEALVVGTDTGLVHVVDTAGAALGSGPLSGAEGPVYAASFNPDGSQVAAVDGNGMLHVWNRSSGEVLFSTDVSDQALRAVAFSSDGSLIATAGDDGVMAIRSADTGELTAASATGQPLLSVAFGPGDADLVSSGADGLVKTWPLNS